MKAFLYGAALQWRLDLRSRALLIACYLVPLLFFAVMGGIFTAVQPEMRATLTGAMTVFGVTMGAFIGVPPSLTELYGGGIQKVYRINGVPAWLGVALCGVSAFAHLLLMSLVIWFAAPAAFGAAVPAQPWAYFVRLAALLAASLSWASAAGLAVRDPAKATTAAMLLFLPSILLSGILFPASLLPAPLRFLGRLLPAWWGARLLADGGGWSGVLPLLAQLALGAAACAVLLRRIRTR